MRRQRFRKPVTSVSLFPFIAVLICTMGALIVLLVLVVQQARVQADTITTERKEQQEGDAQQRKRLLQDLEDIDWRRGILEQQRAGLNEQMAESRLELSHLEDHVRRLEDKLKRLRAEALELERLERMGSQDTSSNQAEIQRLRSAIQQEREELEAARGEIARRRRSFAIVTYNGPNGTRRRPIYIECSQARIVIQPEGIELGPSDMSGPLGPGNPLDAALRAIREHWAHVEGDAARGEPYPLLIVRPDGALAYSMARAAMSSWDDEFGYELVDGEMELAFPPSDPLLKRMLEGTIRTARQRQAMLAAAMPSRFERSEVSNFRIPDRDTGGPGGGSFGAAAEGHEATGGFGATPGSSGDGYGGSGEPWSALAASGDAATPDQAGVRADSSGPARQAGQQYAGAPGHDTAFAHGADAGDSSHGAGPAGGPGGDCADGGSCQAGGPGGAAVQSMTMSKGPNWALPEKDVSGMTAITRPIVVECHPDRLVIRADRGDQRAPRVISMQGATRNSIDPFVAGIQKHMQRWGMAVAGGYWKPIVRTEVFPGAEARFREFEVLIEGSGIEVQRR